MRAAIMGMRPQWGAFVAWTLEKSEDAFPFITQPSSLGNSTVCNVSNNEQLYGILPTSGKFP